MPPFSSPPATRSPLPTEFIAAMKTAFGERFSTNPGVCAHHGRDESPYPPMAPDAVLFAESTDDVARAVSLCATHRVPVIPFGAGSSLEEIGRAHV